MNPPISVESESLSANASCYLQSQVRGSCGQSDGSKFSLVLFRPGYSSSSLAMDGSISPHVELVVPNPAILSESRKAGRVEGWWGTLTFHKLLDEVQRPGATSKKS